MNHSKKDHRRLKTHRAEQRRWINLRKRQGRLLVLPEIDAFLRGTGTIGKLDIVTIEDPNSL